MFSRYRDGIKYSHFVTLFPVASAPIISEINFDCQALNIIKCRNNDCNEVFTQSVLAIVTMMMSVYV